MALVGKIYVIRNMVNGKGYIGQTTLTLFKRFSTHRYDSEKGSHLALHRAMRKWGLSNFEISLVATCETSQLDDMEKYYIEQMNTHAVKGHGYNLTDGGRSADYNEHGRVMSEDGRKKLSEVHKGNSYAKGHKVSPEARLEMSRAQKNRKFSSPSAEVRAKISATLMGHSVSEEAKKKMSLALKGKKRAKSINPRPPHTDEAKAKIAEFQRGRPKSPESTRKRLETRKANGFKMSDEAKKKLSDHFSGKPLSESHKAAISAALRRRTERIKAESYNLDSPKTLKKIPKTLKGRKYSPEHCENISKALTGRKVVWSEETLAKYRASRAEIQWTEEGRRHLSEGQRRRFESPEQRESNRRASIIAQQYRKVRTLKVSYPNGDIKFFKPLSEFTKTVGVTISCVYRHATRNSGIVVTKGPLSGYAFNWVDSAGDQRFSHVGN